MFSKEKLKTSYAGPKIWNTWPSAVRESDSLNYCISRSIRLIFLSVFLATRRFIFYHYFLFTLIYVEFLCKTIVFFLLGASVNFHIYPSQIMLIVIRNMSRDFMLFY